MQEFPKIRYVLSMFMLRIKFELSEPGTSSLRCGLASVSLASRSEPGHFKTLPTRRHLERLHLSSSSVVPAPGPADKVDGNYQSHSAQAQYASRMSR